MRQDAEKVCAFQLNQIPRRMPVLWCFMPTTTFHLWVNLLHFIFLAQVTLLVGLFPDLEMRFSLSVFKDSASSFFYLSPLVTPGELPFLILWHRTSLPRLWPPLRCSGRRSEWRATLSLPKPAHLALVLRFFLPQLLLVHSSSWDRGALIKTSAEKRFNPMPEPRFSFLSYSLPNIKPSILLTEAFSASLNANIAFRNCRCSLWQH